ncbi:MAG TPA: hypothetical protein VJN93_07870 [Candidatus Acidoferrum sp.]|nr:hypothetical protein [Candidatus Acidoferrum sp.]
MFTIRKEQFAIFQKKAVEDFESQMLVHLRQFFPEQAQQLGEPGMRDLIRYGIQRAASYEIVEQPDVCQYIDFMIAFGRDFDRDPDLPWASAVLNDPEIPGPSAKVFELQQAAAALNPAVEDEDA